MPPNVPGVAGPFFSGPPLQKSDASLVQNNAVYLFCSYHFCKSDSIRKHLPRVARIAMNAAKLPAVRKRDWKRRLKLLYRESAVRLAGTAKHSHMHAPG
ncbi:hypothetical protein DCO57_02615 [Labrenzia sp. 011]|nr:hypothetical protein DCO57_02615 [Labrenzia sp. 011]